MAAEIGAWPALLAAASLACLMGHPVLGLVGYAVLLVLALHEGAASDARRRLRGHAVALISLGCITAVSLPQFLSPALDRVVVLAFTAVPLCWLCGMVPTVWQGLRVRRSAWSDGAWVIGGMAVALPLGLAMNSRPLPQERADLIAMTVLVGFVPIVDEALYRGVLMEAVGDSTSSVLVVAVVQGLAVGAAFGPSALAATTALGAVFGFIRQSSGRWQSALSAHWGVALGIAAPLLMAPGGIS